MFQCLTHGHDGSGGFDRVTQDPLEQAGRAAVRRGMVADIVSRKNQPTADTTRLIDNAGNRLRVVATLLNKEGA